jgi:AP-4 complex subunit epsilon-1
MKELVVRMVYVEMLGQDASFAYIKAVELCAATSVAQKKAGYLAGMLMETHFLEISRTLTWLS